VRYLLLVVVLILSTAAPVRADAGLTDAVAAAYFPRTVDDGLQSIANERVAELRACQCIEHDRMRAGTAEVLHTVTMSSDPIQSAVDGWAASPVHDGILSDRSYGRIGCAVAVDGDTSWLACVLAPGPLPAADSGFFLPDTALARPAFVLRGHGLTRPI
jgi:hypothetical protein